MIFFLYKKWIQTAIPYDSTHNALYKYILVYIPNGLHLVSKIHDLTSFLFHYFDLTLW